MRTTLVLGATFLLSGSAFAAVEARQTPFGDKAGSELKNDAFVDGGGQAYLQLGFVEGEKAGIWVQVPAAVPLFKVDSFRVLMGSSKDAVDNPADGAKTQVYFQMGLATSPSSSTPADIENAADVTPGAYWNDIPAVGQDGPLKCAHGGDFIGAAVEFTQAGAPSVYRDLDGLSNVKYNTLFAIPGGWNYSVAFGLRGDWILRVVGHPALEGECG
jgi:hypothetical protein